MTYKIGKDSVTISDGEVTNIAFGTTADYAYERYLAKKRQIADLEYECGILVDKYHAEMRKAKIPFLFSETHLKDMFDKEKKSAFVKTTREMFLEKGFSKGFLKKHKVKFVTSSTHGYSATAVGVVLGIDDYEYTIEFPQPRNIRDEKDKEQLMGEVKFRVDRLHKSKINEFVRTMEPVQMPTYDWKKCFEAIERTVESEQGDAK